jgi:hypothetical protein
MPLPEIEPDLGVGSASADTALFMLAQVEGSIRRLASPAGLYRVHGANDFAMLRVSSHVERQVTIVDRHFDLLARHCRKLGLNADPARWRKDCYLHQLQAEAQAMRDFVHPGDRFILLDEDQWNHHSGDSEVIAERFALPFLERDGAYWGLPSDDHCAIRELERMRGDGHRILAITSAALWWLDYYPTFYDHLKSRYPCILDSDYMVIFDLQPEVTAGAGSFT